MTLYPNKSGWISNLLEEAKQHLKVEGPLRLLELMSSKIFVIYRPDENIDHLTNTTQKSYRIEEIPPDQRDLTEDEMLVPVAHYQKEAYSTFGHPFLLKVKEGNLTIFFLKFRILRAGLFIIKTEFCIILATVFFIKFHLMSAEISLKIS